MVAAKRSPSMRKKSTMKRLGTSGGPWEAALRQPANLQGRKEQQQLAAT